MKKRQQPTLWPVRIDNDLLRYLRERADRERRTAASVLRQIIAEAAQRDQQQATS